MLDIPQSIKETIRAKRLRDKKRKIESLLKAHQLRPTRQRHIIAGLLFGGGHRHVHADMLKRELLLHGEKIAPATVYNTLNHFAEAGLLRPIAVIEGRHWFDTDTGAHHHFYFENEQRIIDISGLDQLDIAPFAIPEGYHIKHIDISVHLIKIDTQHCLKEQCPLYRATHSRIRQPS